MNFLADTHTPRHQYPEVLALVFINGWRRDQIWHLVMEGFDTFRRRAEKVWGVYKLTDREYHQIYRQLVEYARKPGPRYQVFG